MVTKRGAEAAAALLVTETRRLQQAARPAFKDLLLSGRPRADIPMPKRGKRGRREPARFD